MLLIQTNNLTNQEKQKPVIKLHYAGRLHYEFFIKNNEKSQRNNRISVRVPPLYYKIPKKKTSKKGVHNVKSALTNPVVVTIAKT